MKLAFSTLGCPDFDWPDICAMAKDFGFNGIEVRGLGQKIFSVKGRPFSEENLQDTVGKLKEQRLEISCLSSGCSLKWADKTADNQAEIEEYIRLAEVLGTRYIRILADEDVYPKGEVDDGVVCGVLKKLSPVAEQYGITLLVETNGVYADTQRLQKLLAEVASDSVAALWDIHHPYRVMGEHPETTVQNLGAYIRYVHAKDSVLADSKVQYRFMGEGDLPICDMMNALRSINYDGYISLEWVKRWMPELSDAGVVFPHFMNYMLDCLGGSVTSSRLYKNKTGTGQYIWEKDTLIDLTFSAAAGQGSSMEFPDQYAFRCTSLDYTRTYKEFRDDVDTFRQVAHRHGVCGRGSHVAIWATNVPAWYITFWAATKNRSRSDHRQYGL